MKKLVLLVVLAVFSLSTFAQDKISEGVITMKQTMSSDNEQMNAQLAMIGDMTTTTYFKKGKSRAEISNPMSGDITVIINQASEEMLMLMDGPMGKLYGKKSMSLTEEQLEKITVTPTDETKTILGYECKRVDISMEEGGAESTMKLYVSDAFDIPMQQTALFGDKIKGMPMYMVMEINQMGAAMTMTFEVTDVKNNDVRQHIKSLPVWVVSHPGIDSSSVYGVGLARSSDLQTALRKSTLQAEFDVAKKYGQELSGSEKVYTSEHDEVSATSFKNLIENLVFEVSVTGYKVQERVVSPVDGKYEVATLINMPHEAFEKSIYVSKRKNKDAEMKAAFDDLDESLNRKRRELVDAEKRAHKNKMELVEMKADVDNHDKEEVESSES